MNMFVMKQSNHLFWLMFLMKDAKSLMSVKYDIQNDELFNDNWVKSNIPGYRSNIIKRVSNNMLLGHISIVYKNIIVRKTINKASSGRKWNHDLIVYFTGHCSRKNKDGCKTLSVIGFDKSALISVANEDVTSDKLVLKFYFFGNCEHKRNEYVSMIQGDARNAIKKSIDGGKSAATIAKEFVYNMTDDKFHDNNFDGIGVKRNTIYNISRELKKDLKKNHGLVDWMEQISKNCTNILLILCMHMIGEQISTLNVRQWYRGHFYKQILIIRMMIFQIYQKMILLICWFGV